MLRGESVVHVDNDDSSSVGVAADGALRLIQIADDERTTVEVHEHSRRPDAGLRGVDPDRYLVAVRSGDLGVPDLHALGPGTVEPVRVIGEHAAEAPPGGDRVGHRGRGSDAAMVASSGSTTRILPDTRVRQRWGHA